jgi:hypothetical protein
MLAKGSDATLKKLASDELASPADPVTQLALADAWWNLADSSPPAARPQIHLRASKWYGAAAPSLTGLTKLKAEQRGEAYASQTASTAPVTIAAAKPAQAGPAAPTDPTAADAPTGEQPLTSIAQILGSLDPKLFPSTIAGWSLERQAAVNDALAHGPTGRAADLTFVVENINRFSAGSLYLTSRQITVGKFMARVNATLDSKKYDVYRTVREGQTITAKGKVGICRFDGTVLYVTLYQCQP